MSIIKLFLPINSYYETKCDAYRVLFGDVIKNKRNGNISIYVLSVEAGSHRNALQPIGLFKTGAFASDRNDCIREANYIVLLNRSALSDSGPNCRILIDRSTILPLLNGTELTLFKIQVMLYDLPGFQSLSNNYEDEMLLQTPDLLDDGNNSLMCLTRLLQLNKREKTSRTRRNSFFNRIFNVFQSVYLMFFVRLASIIRPVFGESAIYRHFSMWSDCIRCYSFQRWAPLECEMFHILILIYGAIPVCFSGKAWTIVLDVVAGMILMISLLQMVDPGQHLIEFTEVVVDGSYPILPPFTNHISFRSWSTICVNCWPR